jgi:hypothetical protein
MSSYLRGWRVLMSTAALITCFTTYAAAQHENHYTPASPAVAELSGRILCTDGQPLPGAVVQVLRPGAAVQPVASALSDPAGRFRVRVSSGSYTMRVSYLGHTTLATAMTVAESDRQRNLGDVRLEISAVEMAAVVAVAKKEAVRLQAGTVSYDVASKGLATTGTVAGMLRNIPGLALDASGNIILRGNAGVLVLVNGQRTSLTGDALAAFLKQMPASAVEKIEVNTSPSATVDAESSGGVINFVFTGKNTDDATPAYHITASGATARQFVGTAAYSGSLAQLKFDALYSASSLRPHTSSRSVREQFLGDGVRSLSIQDSHADARHSLHNLLTGGTVQLNPDHQLTLRGSYSWMRGAFDNATAFEDLPVRNSTVTQSTLLHTMPNTDVSLGWTYGAAAGGGTRLSSELRFANGSQNFRGRYADRNADAFLLTEMTSKQRDLAFRTNGSFGAFGYRLEVGYQGQTRRVEANNHIDRTGVAEHEKFAHAEDIHGLYLSAGRSLGFAFLTAGLRAELTHTSLAIDGAVTGDDAARLFPSASLHWPHEGTGETDYQIAYSRRTERPDAAALNPYSMGEDDMNSFIGNPRLSPEMTDQLEFSAVRHWNHASVQVAPYLRYTREPIRAIKAVTTSGRATTSLLNLDYARAAGVDFTIRGHVSDHISAMISTNVFYGSTRGAAIAADGIYADMRANVDVQIAPTTTLQLYAYRRSAQPIEQGMMEGVWNSDVAIVHRFGVDQRGTLALRLSDPFDTDLIAFEVGDPAFSQRSTRKVTTRMVSFSLSWAVGNGSGEVLEKKPEKPPRIF